MATLLLVYRLHPVAAWATLTVLLVGTLVVRRRKASAAFGE
jgi:hypothetical protein